MHEIHAAISKHSFCIMFSSLEKFATKINVILFVNPLLISYLVQSLVFLNELLQKYEYFCRYIPILENHTMDYHGDPTISHNPNVFI